jgi:hypothetical protein
MDSANWMSDIGHAALLFIEAIPDAFWLAYAWAKDWQVLLTGLLVIVAAEFVSLGRVRAARINASAMIRSAQIAAGAAPNLDLPSAVAKPTARPDAAPPRPASPESELLQKLEQLRSLIRSAMSTLTVDATRTDSSSNFYCERIARFGFDETNLPVNLSPTARELHHSLLLQLAVVRKAMEKNSALSELSRALVQLNARARGLAAAIAPTDVLVEAKNIQAGQ